MERAADGVALDASAVAEVGAKVRAVRVEDTHRAVVTAEGDEIDAERVQRHDRTRCDLVGEQHAVPAGGHRQLGIRLRHGRNLPHVEYCSTM